MFLKTLGAKMHNASGWSVILHDEFVPEYMALQESVQNKLIALTANLAERGPLLGRPYVDTLKGSRHSNMKELRFKAGSGVWRVAFAFDPAQKAILLIAGDKAGVSQQKFYLSLVRLADERFDRHLNALRAQKENKNAGDAGTATG